MQPSGRGESCVHASRRPPIYRWVVIFFGLVACWIGDDASAQSSREGAPAKAWQVRIRPHAAELNGITIGRCVAALRQAADRRAYRSNTFLSSDGEWSAKEPHFIDISVSVATSPYLYPFGPRLHHILNDVALFASVGHVARFLESDLFEIFVSETTGLVDLFKHAIIGYAYSSAAQIFTQDRPILTPEDLNGRTLVGAFGSWWYASRVRQLRIGHDPILGHTRPEIVMQKEALTKALVARPEHSTFVVFPMHAAPDVVPRDYAKYASLTMTHVIFLAFLAEGWPDWGKDKQDVAKAIVEEAALICSRANAEAEAAIVASLERGGTEIVPVDVGAFLKIARDKLADDVREAESKMKIADRSVRDSSRASSKKRQEVENQAASAKQAWINSNENLEFFDKVQGLREQN